MLEKTLATLDALYRLATGLIMLAVGLGLIYLLVTCDANSGGESTTAPAIDLPAGLAPAEAAFAERAVAAFRRQCAPLARYAADIESTAVEGFQPAYDFQRQRYGWDRTLYIEVVVRDDAEHIPRAWRAWGHRCRYVIGAGDRPGLDTAKDQCQRLCDMPVGHGRNTWAPLR